MGGLLNRMPRNESEAELVRPINNESTNSNQQLMIPQLEQKSKFSSKGYNSNLNLNQNSTKRYQSRLEKQMQLTEKKEKYKEKWYEKIYFTPESKFIIFFKLVTLMLIYLYFLQIPITIAFEKHRNEQQSQRIFQMINVPAIFIFLAGVLIKFKTAFYRQGILIYCQKQIIYNYFIYSFVFDFLSITSIIIYQFFQVLRDKQQTKPMQYRFLVILFYLKIPELFSIQKSIIASFQLNRRVKAFFKLILLLVKIFMLCNVAACFFFYVSDATCPLDQCAECCWVRQVEIMGKPIIEADWIIQYSFSLYWASTTMLTIGYGDITPENLNEVVYTVSAQFISCVIFAFSINQIWSIIQQKNAKKIKIHSRMNVINVYMRDKNVSLELKSRVNAYLSHFYHTKNLRQKELQHEIISQLTPSLRKQLFFQSYGFLFQTHPFFSNFSSQFLEHISEYTRQVGYFQQQVVYSPKVEQNLSLYYIHKGELQLFVDLGNSRTRNIVLDVYERGEIAGLYEFMRQLNYASSLMAIKYSLLYVVDYDNWIRTIREYQEDFQKYSALKHSFQYERKYKKLKLECKLCGSQRHQSDMCLKYQLQSTNQLFLTKYLRKADRMPFTRKNVKTHFDPKSQHLSIQPTSPTHNQRFVPHRKASLTAFLSKKQKHSSQKKTIFQKKAHNEKMDKILKMKKQKQSFWQDQSQQESEVLGEVVLMIDSVQNYQFYCPIMNASADWGRERRRNTMGRMIGQGLR